MNLAADNAAPPSDDGSVSAEKASGEADTQGREPAGAEQEFALGGQAVIEGVMMRSPNHWAVAVRRESGEIVVHDERAVSLVKRKPYLNRPFIRGVFALFESLILGLRSLNYSANVALEDAQESEETEPAPSPARPWIWAAIVVAFLALAGKLAYRRFPEAFASFWEANSRRVIWTVAVVAAFFVLERLLDVHLRKHQRDQGVESAMPPGAMAVTIGLSFALGIGLFVLLPDAGAEWIGRRAASDLLKNVLEGVLRMVIFVAYVVLIGLLPDLRRVFQFHGAEHKVVWTQEKNLELTPDNARQFSTAHPRCGTSFVLFVLVLGIIVFSCLGRPPWPLRIASRIVLLPLIAGVGYEILKLSAKRQSAWLANLIISPGLCLQRLTTREPDDDQVAVAIRAMDVVLQREAELRTEQQTA